MTAEVGRANWRALLALLALGAALSIGLMPVEASATAANPTQTASGDARPTTAAPDATATPTSSLSVAPEAVAAAPRIGVLTMLPGEIFWERFGHNAIVVVDATTGVATSYNFGFFDLDEPGFTGRFVKGDMRYKLAALPVEQDLSYYQHTGRGVSVQWLDLPAEAARQLAAALAENARPENAYYRYNYFLDNCSTRVRDALDRAVGGRLRRQLEGPSHGYTFRSEALRLASPAPWMSLGFDLGMGPAGDVIMPVWAEAFVPMRLADALRRITDAGGRPLVREERELLPHRLAPEPQERGQRWWLWGAGGLVIGGALAWLGRRRPRVTAVLAMPLWIVAGLIGAALLFGWIATEHRFMWANRNLFLLNPLAWLLLPGGVRLLLGRTPGRMFQLALVAVAVLCVAGLFALWLPIAPQRNAHWIALLLPIHAGLWVGLRRR